MAEEGVATAPPEDYDSADDYVQETPGVMYKGEEDRRMIEAMSELDRETILGERFDKWQRRQEALMVSTPPLASPRQALTRRSAGRRSGQRFCGRRRRRRRARLWPQGNRKREADRSRLAARPAPLRRTGHGA